MREKTEEVRFTRGPMPEEKPDQPTEEMDELDLPERRKYEHYERLTGQLTSHEKNLEARLSRFFSRALAAFAVMGMCCAISILGFTIVLKRQHEQTNDIQNQRYDSFLSTCNEQNGKNIAVNQKIDDAISNVSSKNRFKAEQASKPFRVILNAAVPLTLDCYAYAASHTGGDK
jgi:hypothetical protein